MTPSTAMARSAFMPIGRRFTLRGGLTSLIAAAATLASAAFSSPLAWGEPDPHIPNGTANWCPGGDHRERMSGGGRYCIGAPFADGTFYAQSWGHSPSPFGPGYWTSAVICSVWIEGTVQGANPGGCGGGPRSIDN